MVREEKGDEYFLLREQFSLLFFMSLSELNYRQSGGGSDVSFNHTGFTSIFFYFIYLFIYLFLFVVNSVIH